MPVTRASSGGRLRGSARASRGGGLNKATVAALVVMLVIAAVGAWGTHTIVRDQERRLVKERAAEIGLVFTTAINGIRTSLTSDRSVLVATAGSGSAFVKAAAADVLQGKRTSTTLTVLVPAGGGNFRVVAVSGPLFKVGQLVTGARARALTRTQSAKDIVPTPILSSGDTRVFGIAFNAPGIRAFPGAVIYREARLGPVTAPRQADSAPFHEINVVLYATPNKDPSQLLVSSTGGALPANGSTFILQSAGATNWLLGVRAKSSLAGGVASNAWWIVLVGGIVAALLVAAVIEFAIRRRNAALSLYAVEHQQAETLQRSLLPTLPQLPGLELAARYQAGGTGQQVGGDWFDAFPLGNGGVGFAIGDVIGHDLEAAAAMSQVRAALRAYAYDGDEPAVVISRLDQLITTFDLTQLVSVVYGVLDPVADDGTRVVRFANAGHLPLLLQNPDGRVSVLNEGASVVIGAPFDESRGQAELILAPESTLLLFTDGLLEAPDLSLSETIPRLAETMAKHAPSDGADALCDRVLASRTNLAQRDDIALLAVRLLQAPGKSPIPRSGDQARQIEVEVSEPAESLSTASLPARR
jgi:serine phosphatase RsbU (regulator of sigma subunit)